MSSSPKRLLEMFGTTGFYNSSAGLAQMVPGAMARERAYGVAAATTLERVLKDLGASAAREVSAEMLKQNLRPADFAANPEILDTVLHKIQKQLEEDPEVFLKSLTYYLSNVG